MKNYSCILIDDELLARSLVREYLQDFPFINILHECGDGFEGLKAIQNLQPDFIFLDIQMPKINGFEMLELLDNPPPVIFTTAFDSYAMQAFETHALDYLLKPIAKDRFAKAISKMLVQLGNATENPIAEILADANFNQDDSIQRIVVKHHHEVIVLPLQDVKYFEAYGDYIKIHTATQTFLKKKTMAYFEKGLAAKDFIRVHRSYIIPTQQIQKIDPPDFVVIKDGEKIPLSKTGYVKLKTVLGL